MNSLYTQDMLEAGARAEHQRMMNEACESRCYRKFLRGKRARSHEKPHFSRRELIPAIVAAIFIIVAAVEAAYLVAL